jgi:hypothetical protein
MNTEKQIEYFLTSAYAYKFMLSDDERKSLHNLPFKESTGQLLYLRGVGEIEPETYIKIRKSGGRADKQIEDFFLLSFSGKTVPNGENAIYACAESVVQDGVTDISFGAAVELLQFPGVIFKNGYILIDSETVKISDKFGLESIIQTDEPISMSMPQNADKLNCVLKLDSKNEFFDIFAEKCKSGEIPIDENLPAAFETFCALMSAKFVFSVFRRTKKVYFCDGLIKSYDFAEIPEMSGKEITLNNVNQKPEEMRFEAIKAFVKQYTVKPGNVIKIKRNGETHVYSVKPENIFTPVRDFDDLPVDCDKIWEHLKKFKLFSSFTKALPPEVAKGLTEEEQKYARFIIMNQLQSPTEHKTVKKRTSLEEMLQKISDPEFLEEIKQKKNGTSDNNAPI